MDRGMRIRPGLPGEAARLTEIAIESKAHWGYDQEFMARAALVLTITPDYIRQNGVWVLVDDLDGEVAGFHAVIAHGEKVELDHLWLLPGRIGTGLGRLLFDHAVSRARELGALRLEWEAEPNAVGFYERMGGRVVRETTGQLGRPLPVMELALAGG